jgi:hypothetical protein
VRNNLNLADKQTTRAIRQNQVRTIEMNVANSAADISDTLDDTG